MTAICHGDLLFYQKPAIFSSPFIAGRLFWCSFQYPANTCAVSFSFGYLSIFWTAVLQTSTLSNQDAVLGCADAATSSISAAYKYINASSEAPRDEVNIVMQETMEDRTISTIIEKHLYSDMTVPTKDKITIENCCVDAENHWIYMSTRCKSPQKLL